MLVDPMLILAGDYLAQDGTSWVPRGWIPLVSGGLKVQKLRPLGPQKKSHFDGFKKQGEHRQYKA
jgi:hypothetical protein